MPRTTVASVSGDGSARELTDHVGATAREPVRIGEHHHGLGIGGTRGDDALVDGNHDLGELAIGRGDLEEPIGLGGASDGLDAVEQQTDVILLLVFLHCGGQRLGGI